MTGVYFLYLDKELIYIGQSINIDNRLKSHKFKYDMVSIINCNADELKLLERSMIREYGPSMNKILYKHPRGTFGSRKFTLDITKEFKDHIEKCAKSKGIKNLGTYMKAVLKKASKYKEPEIL